MRGAFLWCPFHPAGYALSNAWGANVTWFPLSTILMGLILGDFLTGCIWSIIGTLFRILTYSFWVY